MQHNNFDGNEVLRRGMYLDMFMLRHDFRPQRNVLHIIVDGGRATLKGVVDTEADKNQAYIRARGVSGLFAVTNELMVKGESLVR